MITYQGIPRNWGRLEDTEENLDLKKVNTQYRPSIQDEYSRNCAHCVVAYEMRMRYYDVTAQPRGKNHFLQRNPEQAWIESVVIDVECGEDSLQKI